MIAGEHRLALPAGFRLGKYNLISVLGAGGFGITYLADDFSLGRRVAIKELLPNDIATRLDGSTVVAKTKSEEENLAWARDRFMQEGRALAACDHPNVVNVYEMIEANGTAYMITKFEEGRSFSEWLKEVDGAPTEKELRAILLPLLAGLEKVHKAGFLHRDLKPENIYLTNDGRPILLDFGSARQAVSDRTTSLTSIVTSGYAPFEQYHEDGKQGAWSDLYALAAVMYRAIHGKKPPEATRRLKDDPCLKLAREYAGKYSTQFLGAIDKALAVEPQKRPQSVAQWLEMLGELPVRKEIVVPAWWEPWLEKLQQAVELAKSKPYWAGGAGAALLVLILVLSLHKKPVPPVPTPTPTASASASASPSFSSSPLPSASTSPRRQTIVVPPPYGNTVAQSIDLGAMIANAAPGATITVPPGLYPGSLVVTKAIRIVGDPKSIGQIFIKADGRECLSVKASGVFVQNVQFLCTGIGKLAAISVSNGADLEMDGCTVQSGTDIGLLATGNASLKLNATTFTAPSGVAVRLTEHTKASLTQCYFPDVGTGLNVLSGSIAELHSCAFDRTGGYNGFGAILALNGEGTNLTADDCHFTANKAGIVASENASLTIANSSFKENGAGAQGGIVGLISVRRSARATLIGDAFEANRQGIAVMEGGNLEMQKCRFNENGAPQTRQIIFSSLPISVIGRGSSANVRQTTIANSMQNAISVAQAATLTLEQTEIFGSRNAALVVGEENGSPAHAEIKRSHLNRNGVGLGVIAGSSAMIEDSECRENQDGIIAFDQASRLTITKSALSGNRDHGLYVYGNAEASAVDCDIQSNARGVLSGMRGKSTQRARVTLENCRFGGNKVFGAGAAAQSDLSLTNCVFDGSDKTNIYKERGANIQINEPPTPAPSTTPPGDAEASPAPEESPSPSESPSSSTSPSPSPEHAKSTPRPRRKSTRRPHPRTPEDIGRALRRLLPGSP